MNKYEYFVKWIASKSDAQLPAEAGWKLKQVYPIASCMSGWLMLMIGAVLWDKQGVKLWVD